MPRFDPDTSDVRATARIFEGGQYELEVRGITPFINIKRDTVDEVSAGMLIWCQMVGQINSTGELSETFAGEDTQPVRCYWHTVGSQRMSKQFLIAALGFTDEDEFNVEYPGTEPFFIDGEPGDKESITHGQGWKDLVGKRFRSTLGKDFWQGSEQQTFSTFLTIN